VSALHSLEGAVPLEAPPIPGDGPIVYINGGLDLLIIARLPLDCPLAEIWSWSLGDPDWVRNYAC
jgi:hypothetical protein